MNNTTTGNNASIEPARAMVWMDLEMTGLDPDRDLILEAAAIITDFNLEVVEQAPPLVIHYEREQMPPMDSWNQKHHTTSGLLDEVQQSEISIEEAEAVLLQFVSRHAGPCEAPLCGNSVWQDRRFLCRHMPGLERFLHYRIVDVSTIKELARRWHPALLDGKTKKETHRAMHDIRESINELRLYRDHFFQCA